MNEDPDQNISHLLIIDEMYDHEESTPQQVGMSINILLLARRFRIPSVCGEPRCSASFRKFVWSHAFLFRSLFLSDRQVFCVEKTEAKSIANYYYYKP